MSLRRMLMETLQDVKFPIILLKLGYYSIIQASLEVTEEDLLSLHDDKSIRVKLSQNPLNRLILSLADLLETDSQESQDLDTEKRKQTTTLFHGFVSEPVPKQPESSPQ